MIKLSDFVTRFLVEKGIHDIFLVSGGGIMHLTESVGRQEGLRYHCNYHEQACAIAAEGYARMTGHLGVSLVTTGPGSTNALSGVAGAWVDSIPVIVISGQVRRELIANYSQLRQFGPQEINIIDMVKHVTKYATTVMEPEMIRYELEAAFAHALGGRPGPAWINIPLDVQGAMIDDEHLLTYPGLPVEHSASEENQSKVHQVVQMLQHAKRPILILGNGVRLAHAEDMVTRFVQKVRIPTLLTIGAMDLLGESEEFYMGKFGPIGQRRANFALQNSDLLLSVGASMSVASIGFNTKGFAPHAKRVMVNIDEGELGKSNYIPDLPILADAGWFIEEFMRQTENIEFKPVRKWLVTCELWKQKYPIITPQAYEDKEYVNSYVFAGILADLLTSEDVIVTGNSLDAWSIYQSFPVKQGQRIFTNVCYGSMGWDLPAVIGTCVARGNKRTVLVTGDGSLLFNSQELQTIGYNQLNIKVFVLNNRGYESIRATQKSYFGGHFVGSDESSGICNPNFAQLAAAYGIHYTYIDNNDQIADRVVAIIASEGPMLCELNLSYHQVRSPRVTSAQREDGIMESKPLEDMFPFLTREELWENMHIFDEGDQVD
jgi:acetolactate synthase I/II/III large subunit